MANGRPTHGRRAFLKSISLALLFVSVPAVSLPDPTPTRYQFVEVHMGVPVRIALYAPSEEAARVACRAAFDRFAALEGVMSDYRPTSELMRLCAQAGKGPVPISDDLMGVLQRSQQVAERSEGAFDATVGPLVRLWRTARKEKKLPDPAALKEAKTLVGWRKLHLDTKARTATLDVPGMQLDLGGIAKGLACDAAQKALKSNGITRALVEAGGDIVVSGPPPGTEGWRIAVGSETMTVADRAISTSGDTEQFVEIDGRRYSHIVDPRTGLGLTTRIAVTVTAPDGTTSDSLSTAVSVLGEEKGKTLAATYPGVTVVIRGAALFLPLSRRGRGGGRGPAASPAVCLHGPAERPIHDATERCPPPGRRSFSSSPSTAAGEGAGG